YHLSFARLLRFEQSGDHAERKVESAAPEVTDQVERWQWPITRAPDRMQRSGERYVVDIVSRRFGQRPLLAPAGHTPENQPWIPRQAPVGTQSQPLHDAGPKTLDQCVGFFDQAHDCVNRLGFFEIECD